jgi:hypothetical protein
VEGYDVDHEYAVLAYETKKSKELADAAGSSGWKALRTKTNLKRCIVATLPFTFQNICGVPLMFGYTVYFFQMAGVKDPFLGNLIKQLVLVVGILTSFYTVDVVGRRALLIYGGGAMCVINVLVGGLGFMKPTPAGGIALVFLCSLWAFVYANSLAPIGKFDTCVIMTLITTADFAKDGSVLSKHLLQSFVLKQPQSQSPFNIAPAFSS